MKQTKSWLDEIEIAEPCPALWVEMEGNEKARHCGDCDLDVYDLSAMTRTEAEDFIASHQGVDRLCLRLLRRADGTILTSDCPIARRSGILRGVGLTAALASALLIVLGFFEGSNGHIARALGLTKPTTLGSVVMGGVCPPSPPSTPRKLGRIRMGKVRRVPNRPEGSY